MGPVPVFLLLWLSSLMLFSPGTDAQLPCSRRANGCSIPLKLPFPYKSTFRPACNKHDQCYRCGTYYRISRRTCDRRFYENMRRICRRQKWYLRLRCFRYALVYFTAVRVAGQKGYKKRLPWEHCRLVRHCLK